MDERTFEVVLNELVTATLEAGKAQATSSYSRDAVNEKLEVVLTLRAELEALHQAVDDRASELYFELREMGD